MKLINEVQLDFSDVLILPNKSNIASRQDVNIFKDLQFKYGKFGLGNGQTKEGVYPLVIANMLCGSFSMAKALAPYNCIVALHKHYSVDELFEFYKNNESLWFNTFYSMGITNADYEKYNALRKKGVKPYFVNIDVAHGGMDKFIEFVAKFREENSYTTIMAGNVVTAELTQELIFAGVDIVKVGVGSGQNCLTRKIAGVGRPQLSTVLECAEIAHKYNAHICSDGGITQPADFNIALATGSDFCMTGSMFSGTDECDGEIVEHNGKFHKKFFGMSSNSAMDQFNNGKASYKASEGRTTLVPCKGSATHIVEELQGSTRSMLSYIGASDISQASDKATLIRVNNRLNKSFEQYTIGN